jgi:transcriptional regulator with XRE-family HTH domain
MSKGDAKVIAGRLVPDPNAQVRTSVGLGLAIRRARAGRSTLAQVAERAGLSVGLLSLIERGRGNPSIATLARLADALGITLVELVAQTVQASGEAVAGRVVVTAPAGAAPEPLDPRTREEIVEPPEGTAGTIASSGVVVTSPGTAGDSTWTSSMLLQGGQEARVLVNDGALEVTLRDRTAELGRGDAGPLSVDLAVRTVTGGAPFLELPAADDPRWLDVVRGVTPFRPVTLACQMLFTHVVRCTRQDPSSASVEHWVSELRGYLVQAEPHSAAELARIIG